MAIKDRVKVAIVRWLTHSKRDYLLQKEQNGEHQIQFYNWWPVESFESVWLYRFVDNCGLLANTTKKIRFCSVFGSRSILEIVPSDVKVFFTGENLHHFHYANYADGLLGDPSCDLSLGFEYFENDRYIRFPLWLTYTFDPIANSKCISERCNQLRHPTGFDGRRGFAALISKVDYTGLRVEMYNALSLLGKIDSPSIVMHNDDRLVSMFNDDKLMYLRNYGFNICPENSNSFGYVTEKIFEAIYAGCIPVYWGSYNKPEPKILNQDAIIFWDWDDGGRNALRIVSDLIADKRRCRDFAAQPRLLSSAEEEIEKMIIGLRDRIKELIDNI